MQGPERSTRVSAPFSLFHHRSADAYRAKMSPIQGQFAPDVAIQ